jgi:hypothetical protein
LIDHYQGRAADKAAIDYGFHAMISDLSDAVLGEIDYSPAAA